MAEIEWYPNTEVTLGQLSVARALPVRARRMVGPWCFLDRFGPMTFAEGKPMDVAPHPHIGLQTVTWLLGGEILHDDSLGSEAVARPGGVNADEMIEAGHVLAGSPSSVRDRLRRYVDDVGPRHNYLCAAFQWGDLTTEEARRSLDLFSAEVKPALT